MCGNEDKKEACKGHLEEVLSQRRYRDRGVCVCVCVRVCVCVCVFFLRLLGGHAGLSVSVAYVRLGECAHVCMWVLNTVCVCVCVFPCPCVSRLNMWGLGRVDRQIMPGPLPSLFSPSIMSPPPPRP